MMRSILAFVAGVLSWMVVATVLNMVLRASIPGYTQAEPAMAFTFTMQVARLVLGALSSLAAGFVVVRLAPSSSRLPLVLGVVLLAGLIPIHYKLWDKFPIWYHLVFLASLIPLVVLGARLGKRRASDAGLTASPH